MKGYRFLRLVAVVAIVIAVAIGCAAPPPGAQGPAGPAGPAGAAGPAGPTGPQGPLPLGTERGVVVALSVSKPANGTHFVAGDKPVVTVTLKDQFTGGYSKDDFATLNLYLYGPQDPAKTKTAVKLLNAGTDRTKTPHHYVDLLKNTDVKAEGNVLTYALQAVSDEAPGTYIATVWAVLKSNGLQQAMPLVEMQIGTATAEKQIVDNTKCGSCHKGADSGKTYMHHIDPGYSPVGLWSLDSDPVRTCKACHNNDGYAAYTGDINQPASTDAALRTPDPIIRRVHGVHMGEELKNPFNIDPAKGDFKDYRELAFPANVNNCTACHLDDRSKTTPSRQACGSCHDATWFGDAVSTPKGFAAHKGGAQANDQGCAACHPADGTGAGKSVVEAHTITQLVNTVAVTITAPANGKFYAKGDKPVVTLVAMDDKGNPIDHTTVDTMNFSTAGLFVYGPRLESVPVLTMAAKNGNDKLRASASNSIAATGTPNKVWTFNAGDTFKIAVNGNAPQVLAAPAGPQTPDQVRDWLKGVLKDVTVTSNATAGTVTIRSNLQGANSRFDIYDSAVTKIMGWKPGPLPLARGGTTAGTTMEPFQVIAAAYYAVNDLRKLSDPLDYSDPNVTRSAESIKYQLDETAGLKPGTYMIYAWFQPVAGKQPAVTRPAIGFLTFQVGTATVEPKVATNCADCHGKNIFHLDSGPQHPEPFDTDYCKACHDYARSGTGDSFSRLGGTSTAGWSGYGAVPLARRLHGVHFGRYLDYPEGVYAGNPNAFADTIFPQDVRNCTKCHDPKGSPAWKQQPSRLACLACHDSDKARTHAKFNTDDPTPNDPWSGDEVETCTLCHGAGRDYAPDKVHNVANPYKPPYVREP